MHDDLRRIRVGSILGSPLDVTIYIELVSACEAGT